MHNPSPRLKFSRHIQVADATTTTVAGQLVASPRLDRVLIDDSTPPQRIYAAADTAGAARISAWRPDRVEIDTGGMLALHDLYYPGWVAEIDGAACPFCAPMCCSVASKFQLATTASCSASGRFQ